MPFVRRDQRKNRKPTQIRAGMISVIVEVIVRVLGFGLVEPKYVDTVVVVVLLGLLPHILTRFWVCGVEVDAVAWAWHHEAIASVLSDEKALLEHLLVVL